MMTRPVRLSRIAVSIAAAGFVVACSSLSRGRAPNAASIVEGTAPQYVRRDTTADLFSASLARAAWRDARRQEEMQRGFWADIAVLDIAGARQDAVGLDQRTFVAALQHLMTSDPQGAAIAFHALQKTTGDSLVRNRARDGLTMALRWYSDWATIAGLEPDPDSVSRGRADSSAGRGAVELWARTLAATPPPVLSIADGPIVLPLRRSRVGTPIVRVTINGHAHEFWLDTGASMTVISADVAAEAGVRLVAADSLSLGVIGGSIDARAAVIDSLQLGGFTAHGIATAVVEARMLRLDYAVQNGEATPIRIDGVIGVDLLRWMDVVIDVPSGTISIARPKQRLSGDRNLFWVGFPVIRLISKDGQPLLFGLDTGAQDTYVTLGLLRKLPDTHVAIRRGRIGGLGGLEEPTEWVATDVAVSDGRYAIRLLNAPVAGARPSSFITFDGMLGSDIALRTRLHLDFENGVFDVRPSEIRGTAKR
ncbi:MAG: aspartyl protease family protein [Gemmatimonadota bacterium]|nr:aspartyl protease family protein [Gemmatimonadota bacterium]